MHSFRAAVNTKQLAQKHLADNPKTGMPLSEMRKSIQPVFCFLGKFLR